MHIEQGLKCPFTIDEMKAYYAKDPLTYKTYANMKYDYDRLCQHNRANGIGFVNDSSCGATRHIVPEELKISVYLGDIYQMIRYGGSE
ncbi:hypothetical protein Asfd1_15 [Aeromonas phage Asfd_1]|nr:hypothetical protein Asfd1_15 [Aeromonas phage Asfd_1]